MKYLCKENKLSFDFDDFHICHSSVMKFCLKMAAFTYLTIGIWPYHALTAQLIVAHI